MPNDAQHVALQLVKILPGLNMDSLVELIEDYGPDHVADMARQAIANKQAEQEGTTVTQGAEDLRDAIKKMRETKEKAQVSKPKPSQAQTKRAEPTTSSSSLPKPSQSAAASSHATTPTPKAKRNQGQRPKTKKKHR